MNTLENKYILTDVDGVLLNWVDGFERFMVSTHGLSTVDESDYSLAIRYGITPETEYGYIVEFNHSEKIGQLEPLRDAVSGVQAFADAGYKFIVITSLSKNDSSCQHRIENLNRVFGADKFEDFVFLDIGERKNDALAKFKGSGLTWVEDLPKNALDGVDVGLNTFLIRHTYNRAFMNPSVTQVDVWSEIYDHHLALQEAA